LLSQTSAVFTQLLRIGLYTLAFDHVALWRNDAFWTSIPGWLLALLLYDFCYYWLHRMGHEVAVLWAAHAVHHQSQDYNLSTALRQTDRKSTRLNSSHLVISYAVFCLKKKKSRRH